MEHPEVVTGGNLIVVGFGHLGTTKSFTPPKIVRTMIKEGSGGMKRQYATGFEEMTAEAVLKEYSSAILTAMASQTLDDVTMVHKSNLMKNGTNVQRIDIVKGSIEELDDGTLETEKEVEQKIKMAVNFFSREVDGQQIILFDAENLIAIFNGVDLLEDVRSNLQ